MDRNHNFFKKLFIIPTLDFTLILSQKRKLFIECFIGFLCIYQEKCVVVKKGISDSAIECFPIFALLSNINQH